MAKSQRVTIKEIAAEAGVSIQTVSRVLNNRPDVSAKTRRNIQEIIAKHNYLPSSVARGITQGRSYILGVVSASLHYYGLSSSLMSVEQHASERGYTIILRVVHQLDQFHIDEHLNFFTSQHVDGIIWTLPEIDNLREMVLEKVEPLQIPNIFFNMQPHPNCIVVDFDQRLGSHLAVNHLLQQGAETIGIITGPLTWLAAKERYEGWREALQVAGHNPAETLVVHGDWSIESGEVALHQLLQQSPHLDAIYVSNDHMAMGAMKALRTRGYRIPDDIMIVGFDNIPESAFFSPPLTTIATDIKQLGRIVVEKLEAMIISAERDEEWTQPLYYVFKPELVVRESSNGHNKD